MMDMAVSCIYMWNGVGWSGRVNVQQRFEGYLSGTI